MEHQVDERVGCAAGVGLHGLPVVLAQIHETLSPDSASIRGSIGRGPANTSRALRNPGECNHLRPSTSLLLPPARALGLLLDTWAEEDLPDLPPLPAEAIASFVS